MKSHRWPGWLAAVVAINIVSAAYLPVHPLSRVLTVTVAIFGVVVLASYGIATHRAFRSLNESFERLLKLRSREWQERK